MSNEGPVKVGIHIRLMRSQKCQWCDLVKKEATLVGREVTLNEQPAPHHHNPPFLIVYLLCPPHKRSCSRGNMNRDVRYSICLAFGPGWALCFGVMMLEGLGASSVAFLLLDTDADGLAWGLLDVRIGVVAAFSSQVSFSWFVEGGRG